MAATRRTFKNIFLVLYTPLSNFQDHSASIFYLHWLFSCSDKLNFFLAVSGVDLLGVGRRGGVSFLSIPEMTVTVGICPRYFFRRRLSFVNLFRNFHSLEQPAGFPEYIHPEFPTF